MENMKEQYGTSKNLETRMTIYQYATNPLTLQEWVAQKIPSHRGIRILELGCGNGILWKDLSSSFPECEVILSDMSQGMLEKAHTIKGTENYQFQIIDFHKIPFEKESFDLVISNHNLYHALDLPQVLLEISRVLKKGGQFYATTNSSDHLTKLQILLRVQDNSLWPNAVLVNRFGAETGTERLSPYFGQVELSHYENILEINDFSLIMNYFYSLQDEKIHRKAEKAQERMSAEFKEECKRKGTFAIPTKACLFSCIK
jgi:ubiquinone/menaquinone biosynthesis C-methylase UbiE